MIGITLVGVSAPVARRHSAAGTRRRLESAPEWLGGWISAALIAMLLLAATAPLAGEENVASVMVAVVLSLAGGLSLRHPLIAAAVIGVVMTAALTAGGIHVGTGALASPLSVAACAARGHLRTAIGMAAWHALPSIAASGLRGDEAQHIYSQLMQWLLLQGAAILAGTWGRGLARRAGAERARRLSDLAEQRRAIARELHDTGVRAMTHVVMLAENGARRPDQAVGGDEDFLRISATARQATEEMRMLLEMLRARDEHPEDPVLPTLPLPVDGSEASGSGAVAASLASTLEGTRLRLAADGFLVRVHLEGEDSMLPAETAAVLRRCLAEIEANVIRHGDRSTQVGLLVEMNDSLDLVVLNGVAEDAAPELQGGAGLVGMSERLAGIGGRVETTREQRRFSTRIEIPGELEAA